jgi:hypothetical protein
LTLASVFCIIVAVVGMCFAFLVPSFKSKKRMGFSVNFPRSLFVCVKIAKRYCNLLHDTVLYSYTADAE